MSTYKLSIRYSDDRDYRIVAVGIPNVSTLKYLVTYYAGLAGIEDIRISHDLLETEFQQFTL